MSCERAYVFPAWRIFWRDAEALTRGVAVDEKVVRRNFWRKLRRLAARLPFTEDLLAAHYCAFDRQTPPHVKATLLGAIAYFVLPADLIPDYIPVIGYTDDAAVLAGAIRLVAAHLTDDHRERRDVNESSQPDAPWAG